MLRFWLDRGVDGFRIDVANHVLKDPALRDNPDHPAPSGGHKPTAPYDRQRHVHDRDQPGAVDLYRDVRALVDGHPRPGGVGERVLLGETFLAHDLGAWAAYFGGPGGAEGGAARPALHLPLHFGLLGVEWTAPALRAHVEAVEAATPAHGWPSWVLGSHDERRLLARLGPERARQAAVLLLGLRGTPTLYAGDEIGTPDVEIPPDRARDPAALRTGIAGLGRDAGRTPMAWDGSPSAGFSAAPPGALWLPLHTSHEAVNVEVEARDPGSILSLYRRLLALRRARPALHAGAFRALDGVPADVFAWERSAGDDRALVALNLGGAGRVLRRRGGVAPRGLDAPTPSRPTWDRRSCSGRGRGPCSCRRRNHPARTAPRPLRGAGRTRSPLPLPPSPLPLRVALLAPIAWRVPPRHYGPWERVVSLLAEGLVDLGVDVTLFATLDSETRAALDGVCPHPYEEDPDVDADVWSALHVGYAFERAGRFRRAPQPLRLPAAELRRPRRDAGRDDDPRVLL